MVELVRGSCQLLAARSSLETAPHWIGGLQQLSQFGSSILFSSLQLLFNFGKGRRSCMRIGQVYDGLQRHFSFLRGSLKLHRIFSSQMHVIDILNTFYKIYLVKISFWHFKFYNLICRDILTSIKTLLECQYMLAYYKYTRHVCFNNDMMRLGQPM